MSAIPASPDLVLSIHPLSTKYKQKLEDRLGAAADYMLVSVLRTFGVVGAVRRLRGMAPARLVIAYEDEDSRAILPVLECIAALTRARQRIVADPMLRLEPISVGQITASLARLVGATLRCYVARHRAQRELAALLHEPMTVVGPVQGRDVLYLNTNLWFGVKAGGSVGHVAGVANALRRGGWRVRYAAVGDSPVIDPHVERWLLDPPRAHGLPPELNHYYFSQLAFAQTLDVAVGEPPSFIYQRMSIGNYTGAQLSRALGVPLVIEYNGSEVWTARHWGRRMRYEPLALDAEQASLRHAHLVVTVSETLVDQLLEMGVSPKKIVWYPNCVDADVFTPARFTAAETTALRARYGLSPEDIVVAFIGTFGKWHGVDVLARAIRTLIDDHRDWLDAWRVRFVIVGDGQLMPTVQSILSGAADHRYATLTGLVAQHEAPAYLAAADVVVSPHVPNVDGTPFFGSPTKLFEYMAMGKAIVASDLDQIGEVLQRSLRVGELPDVAPTAGEERLAVLAKPACVDELIAGIRLFVEQPAWRARLGANARAEVLRKYLWKHHVQAILERLPGAAQGRIAG